MAAPAPTPPIPTRPSPRDDEPPARGDRSGRDGDGENDDDDDDTPSSLRGPDDGRWGTIALVVLNLAVGVVMAWAGVPVLMAGAGDVVAFGAVDPVKVWNGEVWRLLTACFVHVGAWHLGLNMWVLWQVGRILERLMGTGRFLLVYVVSGLFGFALSLALQPGLTAGASGAVFGAVGGLLAIASVARHEALGRFLFASLVPFVIATFAMGFLLPMVNNVAHFGGLVMGFVLAWGLVAGDTTIGARDDDGTVTHEPTMRRRVVGTAALVASLVGFTTTAVGAIDPRFSPRYHVTMGLRDLHTIQLRAPHIDDALRQRAAAHVQAAVRLAPQDGATLLLEARSAEAMGDVGTARTRAAEAFRRLYRTDRTTTFDATLAELGLLEPQAEMPFVDGFTVRLWCGAALDEEGRATKAPLLKNSCAWLFANARETAVRDPLLAVELAREASAESPESAAITHTLAVSLAEAGRATEGLGLLEKLAVKGDTSLGAAFLRTERQRLGRMVTEQATAAERAAAERAAAERAAAERAAAAAAAPLPADPGQEAAP